MTCKRSSDNRKSKRLNQSGGVNEFDEPDLRLSQLFDQSREHRAEQPLKKLNIMRPTQSHSSPQGLFRSQNPQARQHVDQPQHLVVLPHAVVFERINKINENIQVIGVLLDQALIRVAAAQSSIANEDMFIPKQKLEKEWVESDIREDMQKAHDQLVECREEMNRINIESQKAEDSMEQVVHKIRNLPK